MFTLAFLYAWLADVHTLIANSVEELLSDHENDDGVLDDAGFIAAVWLVARVGAYAGWFVQVGYLAVQAREAGSSLPYWPSMPGVAPKTIREVCREELRLREGRVTAARADVADRIGRRVATIVNETCRETTRRLAEASDKEIEASRAYAAKHGNPVARLIVEIEHEYGEVGRYVGEHEQWKSRISEAINGFHNEFGEERDETEVEAGHVQADMELEEELARIEEEERAATKAEAARNRAAMVREIRAVEQSLGLEPTDDDAGVGRTVGWARVPVGVFTCGFCLLLASRGPVYRSDTVVSPKWKARKASTPVKIGAYGERAYHWGCDCIAVPVYRTGYQMAASPQGAQDFDGENVAVAALELYEVFVDTAGMSLTAANFQAWLQSDEGQQQARRILPDITTDSAKYRRVKRTHSK